MEELVIARLMADTAITALCGNRLYWGRASQKSVYPYARLTRISGLEDYSLDGPVNFADAVIQIDVFAKTYSQATTLMRAIKVCLSGAAWANIQSVFIILQTDLSDSDTPDQPFGKATRFRVIYTP